MVKKQVENGKVWDQNGAMEHAIWSGAKRLSKP